jgi:enamine deaminase RidA (YjgF/YER057c/UK114 family)
VAETVGDGFALYSTRRGEALDLYLTCVPGTPGAGAGAQAERMLEHVAAVLSEHDAQVVQERVFGRLAARNAYLGARRALEPWLERGRWPVHYIEGTPLLGGSFAGVHVYAVAGATTRPLVAEGEPTGVEVISGRDLHYHYLSGIVGGPPHADPALQSGAMFRTAEEWLRAQGLAYDRVARTWLYLNGILDWYGPFNEVRTRLYGEWGVGGANPVPPPASTGILGRVDPSVACSMDLLSVSGPGRSEDTVQQMHNPAQNEAYAYGSSFSRGMAIRDGGLCTAYISGTAAINEAGRSIFEGDAVAQTTCTLDKIAALLGTCGMDLDDIVTATLFVKRMADGEAVRDACVRRSDRLVHATYVLADVCREELLFEAEVTAARRE